MLKVPHQGRGIQKADGGNAQTCILHWIHSD
jgi:hypothetical protein